MEIHQIPALRSPVMILAFSGWNDAAEAATGALNHILEGWSENTSDISAELIGEIDSEDFYDFQVNRPLVSVDDSQIRNITWPGTQIYGLSVATLPFDFVIVRGVEPSMRWKEFSHQILDLADDLEVELIINLGAMLADAPHTRPIQVNGSGAHPALAERLGVQTSRYEGPIGILGIIADGSFRRGIDAISLWAAVPHYASSSPSPKASLALINALEDFLEIEIPQGKLPQEALEWENEVNEMAKEDSDVAEYVKALEESKDSSELSDVTGETLAKELERFLRRQSGS